MGLAPALAAASCAWAAVSAQVGRRAWALLAASAGSWAVGQATWVWYEHVARREVPFPSLADVGFLVAIPLAAAAMLAFPGRSERAALQARSLLCTSWALVLGPVFRAGEGSVLEQAIALAYPVGDVVLATVVFVVVARIRVGGTPLALLFIDLDDFKTVNDQPGHAAGDDLLVAVAGRLKTRVRGEDTVARLGGDEFAILLEQAPSHEVAVRVAGRILEAMRPPFTLGDRPVQVGASVGVTISDASEVDAVLREADVAMYTAKARGKGRFELATTSVQANQLDTVGTIPET